MRKIFFIGIVAILVVVLYACSLTSTPTPNPNPILADLPALSLTVQAQSGVYNTVGQTVPYTYMITNIGTTALTGNLTIVDDKMGVNCPLINTVGNNDNNLDPQESITCPAVYAIIQADLNAASITNHTTAKLGATDSNTVTTVVPITLNKVLELTISPNPASYSLAGQTIAFTFTIKNMGTTPLGPTQFVVNVDRLGAIDCLANTTSLAPNDTITCSSNYITTANDLAVSQLTFNGIATGGGAGTIQPASISIANTNTPGSTTSPNTPTGSVQHQVVSGEWLWQIARCYGVDENKLAADNKTKIPDPSMISPGTSLTVNNPGSVSKYYGPPCIGFYTAQAGDTWDLIASRFNARLDVLQEANRNVSLTNGTCVRVPLNSKDGSTPAPQITAPCTPSSGGNPNLPTTIRINLPNGSGSVSLSGNVAQQNKVRYVLSATQGQTLTIKVTAPANEVALAVYGPNNLTMKPLDATLTWSGPITVSGDHFIDVVSVQTTTNKAFTLDVGLSPSAPVSAFERVADINTGAADSSPAYFAVFNGAMYFKATGSDNTGAELWKYDPGLKAVSRVQDINPGAPSSDPSYLTPFGDALYFSANNNDGAGVELFRFNGSAVGRLGDINPGAGNSNPAYMAVFNNNLYFSADGNDGAGVELWKTDGTAISRVADIHPGTGSSNPAYLTPFNNALYFSATSNDGSGTELWKYDGTNATLVADINSGIGNSNPSYLKVFKDMLYFSANGNDGTGTELWRYDGTNAGRVADINPGAGDSGPTFLTEFNGALYFSATGDSAGTELWMYDGTTTKRVGDLNPSGSSNPAYLFAFDNALFFQANAGDGAGIELWKYKGP